MEEERGGAGVDLEGEGGNGEGKEGEHAHQTCSVHRRENFFLWRMSQKTGEEGRHRVLEGQAEDDSKDKFENVKVKPKRMAGSRRENVKDKAKGNKIKCGRQKNGE